MWAFVLLVTLLLGADVAPAGTSLFLRGQYAGQLVRVLPGEWEATGLYAGGWLSVGAECREDACDGRFWSFTFGAPAGQSLAVGVYEGAEGYPSPDRPRIEVVHSSFPDDCAISGRFEIRELVEDPSLGASGFGASVDFEIRCRNDVLVGSAHIRSGDLACASGAPAVTCDDLDPCTSTDACALGECAGVRDASCNPLTCDDGDPCTDDRRDGTACTHTAIAGSCWLIGEGTVTVASSASAGGRSASCSLRCRSTTTGLLALLDDGTYVSPGGDLTEGCVVETAIPTEVGRIRTGRRGALILMPDNLAEQEEALARCIGRPLKVKDMRTRLRIAEDGTFLTGASRLRYRAPGSLPVDVRQLLRFRATPRSAATAAARARRRGLPACSPNLRPKCVVH